MLQVQAAQVDALLRLRNLLQQLLMKALGVVQHMDVGRINGKAVAGGRRTAGGKKRHAGEWGP
ncbi:hypothetical protein D3C85_1663630 [compost metagenome]